MLRSFMIGALVNTVLSPDRIEFQGAGVAFRGLYMGGDPRDNEVEGLRPIRFGHHDARRRERPSRFSDCVKIMMELELQSLNRPLFFSEIRSMQLDCIARPLVFGI